MLEYFTRYFGFKTELQKGLKKEVRKVFRDNFRITDQSFVNYQLDSIYNFKTDHIRLKRPINLNDSPIDTVLNLARNIESNYHDNEGKYLGYGGYGLFLTQRFSAQLIPFLNTETIFAGRYLRNIGVDFHIDLTTNCSINLGIGLIYRMKNRYIERIEIGMNKPILGAFKFSITDTDSEKIDSQEMILCVTDALYSVVEDSDISDESDQLSDDSDISDESNQLGDDDFLSLRYYLIGGTKPNDYDRKRTRDLLTKDQGNELREKIVNDDRFKNFNSFERFLLQSSCANLFERGINNLRRFFYIQIVSRNFNITKSISFKVNLILGSVVGIGMETELVSHLLF